MGEGCQAIHFNDVDMMDCTRTYAKMMTWSVMQLYMQAFTVAVKIEHVCMCLFF